MSALEFESFSYRHPGAAVAALNSVSLRVAEGEFVLLAGDSGAGKSTLLHAAAGLVPHFHGGVVAGELRVCGLDVREHGPGELAAVVGSLGQEPETQVVMSSVRAELAFPMDSRGWPAAMVARGVEEAALALGIADLLERSTHELSGGELQRVALAAAIAPRPRLLVLDEPTSQLDPVAGDELLGVLRRINEEWGTTVVIAEHRLERCLPAADRVVVLATGAVAFDGGPAGFLEWAAGERPDLLPPSARLFSLAGLAPLPAGVKAARVALREMGRAPLADAASPGAERALSEPGRAPLADAARVPEARTRRSRRARRAVRAHALELRSVWFEPRGAAPVLSGVSLALDSGERVALMGRNGAGKSTLLRVAAGLSAPTRGRVAAAGRVALLLQYPGDYFLRDRLGDELPGDALAAAGLDGLADRHPRDLSGGERQRAALAIVAHGEPPAVLCLDEPTRGMGQSDKAALAGELERRAAAGAAVLVATHDAEFAAEWSTRTVLVGDGRPVADAPTAAVLAGGWYFSTQTARILDGAALLPGEGARILAPQPEAAPAAREAVAS